MQWSGRRFEVECSGVRGGVRWSVVGWEVECSGV